MTDAPQPAPDPALRARRFTAVAMTAVLALFCGVVAGVMLATRVADDYAVPPESARLDALYKAAAAHPRDAALQAALREEDRRVRARYFTQQRRLRTGAWLLLVGVVACVACARWYAALDQPAPAPAPTAERVDADLWLARRRRARIAHAAAACAALAALLALALFRAPTLPASEKPSPPKPSPSKTAAAKPAPAAAKPVKTPATPRPKPAESKPKPAPPAAAPRPAQKTAAAAKQPKPAPQATKKPAPGRAARSAPAGGFKQNWPCFRGARAGLANPGEYPRSWDLAKRVNVLWRADSPGKGKSSPVVWGDQVFLTCGDERKREVVCYDRASGKLLWRAEIRTPADAADALRKADLDVPAETTYAAPTPATDGERVYATFATADLAAVDMQGKVLWVRNLGVPDNTYGKASSLLAYKGRVLMQNDDGMGGPKGPSAMLAFDGATGKLVWRTHRDSCATWSSPILAMTPTGPQLIAMAEWSIAYNPDTGKEIWRVSGVSGEICPSPAYADGVVFFTNEYSVAMAVKTDGRGDVTNTHVLWQADEGLSDSPSPVAARGYFVQAHTGGEITCYNARSGKLLWTQEYEDSFYASLIAAGDVVYAFGEEGNVYLIALADQYKQVGHFKMPEKVYATPAFADSRIYLRTNKALYCIGKKD